MRKETRELSRMAAAALVAAATAPAVVPLPSTSTFAIAEEAVMGTVVDARAEQAARQAFLAERYSRTGIIPSGPPFPTLRTQRMGRQSRNRYSEHHGDQRPHLRRGRYW